jgi:hypothetical protein
MIMASWSLFLFFAAFASLPSVATNPAWKKVLEAKLGSVEDYWAGGFPAGWFGESEHFQDDPCF